VVLSRACVWRMCSRDDYAWAGGVWVGLKESESGIPELRETGLAFESSANHEGQHTLSPTHAFGQGRTAYSLRWLSSTTREERRQQLPLPVLQPLEELFFLLDFCLRVNTWTIGPAHKGTCFSSITTRGIVFEFSCVS
jgi:hypothetical protein